MKTVIHTEGLSKEYTRGRVATSGLLRDSLANLFRSSLRRGDKERFWALRDVSLEVKEGEVLGLIGRNGSGKTTLLKILSRITRPTSGWAEIHGRVGSLLEVGTGFHPELTGRENTFMSGAILGMSKQEITRKFDEIVAFAELEKFIDTAVKHYSSGMYVRLAFAVAAHLEPEILLVDEVLAVGDIKFQHKCMGKMGDVARAGRTIILVSHQLNQIRRLCQCAAWIDWGTLRQAGPIHEVVNSYESAMSSTEQTDSLRKTSSSLKARFLSWEIVQPAADAPHTLTSHSPVKIRFHLEVRQPVRNTQHGIALFNVDRLLMWATAQQDISFAPGIHYLDYDFPSIPLRPGAYSWQVSLWEHEVQVELWNAIPDLTIATPNYQHWRDEWNGVLNIPSTFSTSTTKG
jgi:lipopolysaccharide transport system ATP-binding protein